MVKTAFFALSVLSLAACGVKSESTTAAVKKQERLTARGTDELRKCALNLADSGSILNVYLVIDKNGVPQSAQTELIGNEVRLPGSASQISRFYNLGENVEGQVAAYQANVGSYLVTIEAASKTIHVSPTDAELDPYMKALFGFPHSENLNSCEKI